MIAVKVLGFDPGAKRMGYSVLISEPDKSKPPVYVASGHFGLERKVNEQGKETFQHQRLSLIDFWRDKMVSLLDSFEPDLIANEILPPVGFNNGVQSQLALTALTTIQTVARQRGYEIEQLSALTIKARIGGTKKATKVGVRNGVLKLIPDIHYKRAEWIADGTSDESDALAVSLCAMGYKIHG